MHPYHYTRLSTYRFKQLVENKGISTLKNFAKFINAIMNVFYNP